MKWKKARKSKNVLYQSEVHKRAQSKAYPKQSRTSATDRQIEDFDRTTDGQYSWSDYKKRSRVRIGDK